VTSGSSSCATKMLRRRRGPWHGRPRRGVDALCEQAPVTNDGGISRNVRDGGMAAGSVGLGLEKR